MTFSKKFTHPPPIGSVGTSTEHQRLRWASQQTHSAALIGALLLCGSFLAPASTRPDGTWTTITADHFTIYTSSAEKEGRDLVQQFEEVRHLMRSALAWAGTKETPVRILAFASRSEMLNYAPNTSSIGFFLRASSADYIVVSAPYSSHVLAHEYGHLILSQNSWRLPAWLNEGVPEAYATQISVGDSIWFGGLNQDRIRVLAVRPWIPLADLLQAGYSSPLFTSADHIQTAYAQSWLLAHMLLFDERYSDKLPTLIRSLSGMSGPEALLAVYGRSVDQVERDLHAYLAEGPRTLWKIDRGGTENLTVTVRGDAELDSRLAIADMLRHYAGREREAREAYKSIELDFPGIPATKAALSDSNHRTGSR